MPKWGELGTIRRAVRPTIEGLEQRRRQKVRVAGVGSDPETLVHVWEVVIDEGNPNAHFEA